MTDTTDTPLIAHVIYRLDVGGLENGLVNLLNRLPQSRYRHAIVCLTDYTEFYKRIEVPVQLYALHKRPGKDPGLYLRLWRLFRRLRPDLVHTRNLTALEAQLPAFLAGVPYRVHGEHGRDVGDLDGSNRRYRLLRRLFRPLVQRYIPLSQDLERYLLRDIGVPPSRVRRICNGVDIQRFAPGSDRPAVLPPNFASSGQVVIGTVGRMQAVKDPLNLARAFVELVSNLPSAAERVRLVMVGDGPLRPDVEAFLHQAGLADLCWIPGSRDDVPDLLRAMDLFVLPSLAEGISNTILEAVASGLPVVATTVGGNAELVVAGETGTLVPRADPGALANALRGYIEHPAQVKAQSVAARRRAEQAYSIETMVRRYQSVYDELLPEDPSAVAV